MKFVDDDDDDDVESLDVGSSLFAHPVYLQRIPHINVIESRSRSREQKS